jgi:hypothetical protein
VQVLGHDDDRTRAGQLVEQGQHRLLDPELGRGPSAGFQRGVVAVQNLGDLALAVAGGVEVDAQRVADHAERAVALHIPSGAAIHRYTPCHGMIDRGPNQGGLADPGLALDYRHRAGGAGRLVQQTDQHAQFPRTPPQGRGMRHHVPITSR